MLPSSHNEYKKLIDSSVENYLTEDFKCDNNNWLQIIKEASLYACKWWKRIRSILALEFYFIFSNKNISNISFNDDIIKFCIALELLHAYSLVHDDLPCMDNDELRRGKLTVWKKYGEDNAVLSWDLLNSLSFELLADIWNISLIKYFWNAVWINWMIWWQVLDLYYEKNFNKLDLEKLADVHNKKTGALIETSIIWALIISNLSLSKENKIKKESLKIYTNLWKKIWLAFQVKDDLLDVEWTIEETWKSVGDLEYKWFIYFMGVQKSRDYLDKLISSSLNIISDLNSNKLNFLIWYIWNRNK